MSGRLREEEMKKMTAVMALAMVVGMLAMTATPASAATPQLQAPRPAPAAVMGLMERFMQLLGIRTATPVASPTAPSTPTTDGAIWGCSFRGTC